MDNIAGFYPVHGGSIPSRRTRDFIASETWKSERPYRPFSARLAFLRGFDPLRWYQNLSNNNIKNITTTTMTTSKFSVIIPTMWRYDPFVKFLTQLVECERVDEIILINNDNSRTPQAHVLGHKKIKFYDFGRNIFVNPAWNFGVHVSRNNFICLLSDDFIFDLTLFDRVVNTLNENTGVMGICSGTIFTNGNINIIPLQGERPYGFGGLMYVQKSHWVDIPDGLNIFYGDDWILNSCKNRNMTNYKITNIMHYTPYSVTSGELATNELVSNEENVYVNSMNYFIQTTCPETSLKYKLSMEHQARTKE